MGSWCWGLLVLFEGLGELYIFVAWKFSLSPPAVIYIYLHLGFLFHCGRSISFNSFAGSSRTLIITDLTRLSVYGYNFQDSAILTN